MPDPVRAVIADDEPLLRAQLRSRLERLWPELAIVHEMANGRDVEQVLEAHSPELFFLDIHMPGVNGLEAARIVGKRAHVVFVTAYDQYAVEAFEQGVVDYVLKPAERERLLVTVERIKKRIAQRSKPDGEPTPLPTHTPDMQQLLQRLAAQLNPNTPPKLQWIQATVGQQIQMIPVEDVLFFISDEKYTRVQTATLEALIRKPIKELIEELDMNLFWQIHRSTLVNTKAIAGVSRDLRGRQLVSVKGHPEKLEVSRSFTGLFKGM